MMMLQKDIEYVPESPQKPNMPVFSPSHGTPLSRHTRTRSDLQIGASHERISRENGIKGTEEKRRYLGTMLGNVDALVESVSKAGIWGLG
jgi:hypothetical protein